MLTIWLAVAVVAADQWIKYIVRTHMELGESIPVVPDVLHWTYIENHGAAFGILAHQQWFFLSIVVVLFGLFFWYRARIPRRPLYFPIAVGLLLGGALGNAWDRFYRGGVVDYIDFRVWPIFNLADMAICASVAALMWYFLRHDRTEEDKR